MRLTIDKTASLGVAADTAWEFLRDPVRVAACLPNVRSFSAVPDAENRYATTLVERIGPFSVSVGLRIDVTEDADTREMRADVAGEDRGGQARVRGTVRAAVAPDGPGSRLDVSSDLGRLASLGAVPIRRRGDQVFDEFVRTLAAKLEEEHA
jgi:carbon monoxide dehydrogenase subunit G